AIRRNHFANSRCGKHASSARMCVPVHACASLAKLSWRGRTVLHSTSITFATPPCPIDVERGIRMSDTVLCDIRERIAVLTLNRPAKLNGLNYELSDRLMALLDAIERDETVRAVILTGAGDRAFSAGADIAELAPTVRQGQEAALRDFVRRGQRMTSRIE